MWEYKNKADKQTWISKLIENIKKIADPEKGFVDYEFFEIYKKHSNFLSYIMACLYEEAKLGNFLEKYASDAFIPAAGFNNLRKLDNLLKELFEETRSLKDFDLLRKEEWDTIIPLAQSCLDELSIN